VRDVILRHRARRHHDDESLQPDSLAQMGESTGTTYALWGPKTLRAGLLRFFMTCGVDSTILPSAELQTADYEQCGQKVRMYTELNMRRPVDLGKHMHPLYYILHHKHSISNTMLRAALNSEGRNRTTVRMVSGKPSRGFDGLDFGIFYTGYPNFLVGYSRFVACNEYGCGVDGGAAGKSGAPSSVPGKGSSSQPGPHSEPVGDRPSTENQPVFRPEDDPPQKINPLNDVHQQKLAKLDRSLRNLRRQINEHQHPSRRHMRGWDPISNMELGPELMALPVDVYLEQGSVEIPVRMQRNPMIVEWTKSRRATALIAVVMLLIPTMFHMERRDYLPKGQPLTDTQARLLWGTAYAGCSIVMTVGNKLAVQGSPVLLSALQMGFAVVALLSVLGPTFGIKSSGDKSMLYMWLPVPFFFVTMICSSLSGFSHESISTCVMMGSLRPLYALTIERVCFGQGPTPMAMIGCILLCLGASFYVVGSGGSSGGVTMVGLTMLALNGATAAVDRCYQHYMLVHKSINASRSALLLTSNFGGLALLLLLPGLWRDELPAMTARATKWMHGDDWGDLNLMLLSCLGGLGIGYCGLGFQKTVTASTFLAVATGVRAFLLLLDNQVLGTEMQTLGVIGLVIVIVGSVICVDDQNRKTTFDRSERSAIQREAANASLVAQCPVGSPEQAAPAG
jgi:hypothetical protein